MSEASLHECLRALEFVQAALACHGVFTAECEDKLADVVDAVALARFTKTRQSDITQFFPAAL